MSLHKGALVVAGLLCIGGLALRIAGVGWGLDLLVLSVLVAVGALFLAQRTMNNTLSTTRRGMNSRFKAIGDAQDQFQDALETLTSLERSTLWYAKNRPGSGSTAVDAEGPFRRERLAGRASTPEVSNSTAAMTFAHGLDTERTPMVCGVMSDSVRSALAGVAQVRDLLPCRAVETLEATGPVDLLIIDEEEFTRSPWSLSTGPSGINAMRDLVQAVRTAPRYGFQTVVLPGEAVPDISSATIRSLPVLVLPLSPEEQDQTSGAPLSPVMNALIEIAGRRRSH